MYANVWLPTLFPLFHAALIDLQQANLITGKEGEELSDVSDVVAMQCSKSLEMKAKSADILRRHGYTENAELLSSNWAKY